jgi:arginyl-tRNA synthetase
MKHRVYTLISSVLKRLNLPTEALDISMPEHVIHGTYTTNIGFILGKKTGKNPQEVAQQIVDELEKVKTQGLEKLKDQELVAALEKIEVVGPGFINLTISAPYLLLDLVNKISTRFNEDHKKGRIMIEYTDPNPFKPLHIGHLYSNAVGESIARMYEYLGFEVKRVCYQGDVGLHVGKALFGMKLQLEKALGKSLSDCSSDQIQVEIDSVVALSLPKQSEWLGKAYALGAQEYEVVPEAKAAIERYNIYSFVIAEALNPHKDEALLLEYEAIATKKTQEAYSKELDHCRILYTIGRDMSLKYFESQYKFLGTKFDHYYLESQVAGKGKAIVESHLDDGVFEESSGAIVFHGEKFRLHTRVFINAWGLPTYEAKELGLAPVKYSDWAFDRSVIVTAKEINEYFQVIESALRQIYPELADKMIHLGHGVVKLPEGKMSSRKGNAPTIEGLFELVRDALSKVMVKRNTATGKNDQETLNRIAIAAVKYTLLKVSLPADIIFDLEKSIDTEGDSGPYLLYTIVRAKNVLKKIGIENSEEYSPSHELKIPPETVWATEELELLRNLSYAESIWQEAAQAHAPSRLCRYGVVVAQGFNALYAKYKIVPEEMQVVSAQDIAPRVLLTVATAKILTKTLRLLGIETVESM